MDTDTLGRLVVVSALSRVPVLAPLEPVSQLVQPLGPHPGWQRHLLPIRYLTGCQATQELKL
jgi:hypothetical protein